MVYKPQIKKPFGCPCEALLTANRSLDCPPATICLRDHETVCLLKAFGVEIFPMDGKCPKNLKYVPNDSCTHVLPPCPMAYRIKTGFSCPAKDAKEKCPHIADATQRCVVT